MLVRFLKDAQEIARRYGRQPGAASEILNDLHGPPLKVFHVGRIVVAGPNTVVLTIQGEWADTQQSEARGFHPSRNFLELDLATLNPESGARELERLLRLYRFAGDGAQLWIVPDGYLATLTEVEKRWEREGGGYFSHEAVCVQNTGERPARCELQVCFEDRAGEVRCHAFEVPARTSLHLRLDKIPGPAGQPFIPKGTPVGYKILSHDGPVIVQGSRILTSGRESEFASFGTTMAWTPR